MDFVRSLPKLGALPELRTYQCKPCSETVTEADEPVIEAGEPRRAELSPKETRC